MRRISLSRLLPSGIELWYIALVAVALILAGNGRLLLERLGLIGSADLIGKQVSVTVTSGITTLAGFQFSASVVNMIIWGVVGLVVYSALQSAIRALRKLQYERDFDETYIHPQYYSRRTYWKQVVVDTFLGFGLLVSLVVGAILYVVVAVPASFAYVQTFILDSRVATAYYPILGLAVAFVATAILYMLIKLVIHHHRDAGLDIATE